MSNPVFLNWTAEIEDGDWNDEEGWYESYLVLKVNNTEVVRRKTSYSNYPEEAIEEFFTEVISAALANTSGDDKA